MTVSGTGGDRAIVAVGRILLRSVRAVDAVARVGGDEFAVLLPETSASQALVLARRIAGHVVGHSDESILGLAVSIGITELDPTGDDELTDALAAADAALYRAKAAGGGHIAVAGLTEPLESSSGRSRSWTKRGSSTGERRASTHLKRNVGRKERHPQCRYEFATTTWR